MSRTHIFIPDTQVKPGVDMTYLSAIGEYIAFKKPDVIVHIGDHADMPSLSSYDKGKAAAEGRRYHKDIDAAIEGMDLLVSPIKSAIQKDKKWKPRMVFTEGNHEFRISRLSEDNPLLHGKVSLADLQYQKFGWEVHDFLKPVEIDGIMYCHFFANPFSGKPYGGSAANILSKVGKSFSQGHKQTFDVTQRYLPTGERQIGLVAGAAYPWDESYKGYQGNKHFRGLVVKHRVENGSYDLMQVSLDYLIDRYKNRHNIPKPEYLADEPTVNQLMNEILENNPRVYMMGEKTLHELIQDTSFCSLLNQVSDNLIKELRTRNFIEDISYTNSQELKEVISRGKFTTDNRFVVLS